MQNTIGGTSGAESLAGTSGDDLFYGYDLAQANAGVTGMTLTLVGGTAGRGNALDVDANPVDGTHMFVSRKARTISVVDMEAGATLDTPFLDLAGQLPTDGDLGLTSMVFDPDFA